VPTFRSLPNKPLILLLIFAGILYAASLPYYDVGWLGDDAIYIEGARALFQGRYVALYDPQMPVQTQFPPGYPLFLMPFVQIVGSHWELLKIPSLLLTLLSVFMLWKLLEGWTSRSVQWAATVLFALNPNTLKYSATVMSEPLYVFSSLTVCWLFRKSLERKKALGIEWVLGGVIGWTAIVRTIGVFWLPSIALGFISDKRWRPWGKSLPLALLPPVGLYLYNYAQAGNATIHLNLLSTALKALWQEGGVAWLDHIHRTIYFFFIQGAAGLELPRAGWAMGISLLLSVFLIAGVIVGAVSLLHSKKALRPLAVTMIVYAVLYFGIHCFWISLSSRFVFPLLPFLIVFLIEGIWKTASRFSRASLIAGGLIGLLGVSCLSGDILFFKDLHAKKQSPSEFPKHTFAWMQQNLPSNAFILCSHAPALHLFTNRHALNGVVAEDIEDFRFRLMQEGVTHALIQPRLQIAVRNVTYVQSQNRRWIQGWPDAFPVFHTDLQERTVLHQIRPDPAFQKAYTLYISAVSDLQRAAYKEGMARLDQALRVDPTLANAHQAYGTALFMTGNFAEAERRFKKALSLRPYFPLALLNLARLYSKTGRSSLAVATYDQALEAISVSLESPSLTALIQQEKTALKDTQNGS
jgi:hypothetical protein